VAWRGRRAPYAWRVDPYRRSELADTLEAPTRNQPLHLEVGPRHVVLTHGPRRLTFTEDYVVVADGERRRKPRSHRRGVLRIARDVPHEDLGLWMETGDDRVVRLFGVEPSALIAEGGLARLRALDRLSTALRGALEPGDGARAIEVGRGLDKVLVVDHGDRLVVHVRPLFRGEARRALEVHRDGRVVVAPDGRVVRCRSRFGVTVLGDYVRFADERGVDLARVPVRWVEREDREELARRFGDMLDGGPPTSPIVRVV
jgi:hypothetical protein